MSVDPLDEIRRFKPVAYEIVKAALDTDALFVSPGIQEQRLNICQSCEFYNESQITCNYNQYDCHLESMTKSCLKSCPILKWQDSNVDWMNSKYEEILQTLMKRQDNKNLGLDEEINDNNFHSWLESL